MNKHYKILNFHFYLIAVLLIILCSSLRTYSKQITVPSHKYGSIKIAISKAGIGDTLLIKEGIYKEGNILIDKPLVILGQKYPVIDAENNGEAITIKASNVIIKGLKVINSGISFVEDNAGIKLEESKKCIVEDNIFEDNFFAVYLAKSSYCKIVNNRIFAKGKRETTSGNGIHLWYCKEITIEKNIVEGHRDGIYIEFGVNGLIKDNISKNNLRYGLHFMFSDSCTYTDNTFEGNGAGVAVMYTKYVKMNNNKFYHNWGSASYGILLKEITDSQIENNLFLKNTSGIYLEGSSRVNISNNNFIENGWAIRLMANSMDNSFENNNFIGNSFDVTTNSVQNYNFFNHNYWSEYDGYDIDKDSIGDLPYRPVKLFSLLVEKNPPVLILQNSLLSSVLNVMEKVFPILTPETLIDKQPLMKRIK